MANLFYVIGASGVGKDSVLRYARNNTPKTFPTVFAHRYITRPANAGGENHIALTHKEFIDREKMGCFAMHWNSHNTCYGVGIEINQWLAKGISVVVNGSRGYLNRAASKYDELIPVLITADKIHLKQRLIERGRETMEEIEQRLLLGELLDKQTIHPNLVRIENNSEIEDAGSQFLDLIGCGSLECASPC